MQEGQHNQQPPPYPNTGGGLFQHRGLEIHDSIWEEYGTDYNRKDKAACYACCMRSFGVVPRVLCAFCACCEKGPVKVIPQGYIGLRTEFGRLIEKLPPGLHDFNQCTEKIVTVDLRSQVINIPPQSLLTRDNVTVLVDAYVNFKIVIPELAAYKVQNYETLVGFMTQGVMKTIVAERTLGELLVNREEVEKAITSIIDRQTDPYGIKVLLIETRSVSLPQNMERAMATVAESAKQKEAKIIDAQGNLESAKIFKRAAKELSQEPLSIQLQYFETLKTISAERNSTIIVPDSIMNALK